MDLLGCDLFSVRLQPCPNLPNQNSNPTWGCNVYYWACNILGLGIPIIDTHKWGHITNVTGQNLGKVGWLGHLYYFATVIGTYGKVPFVPATFFLVSV